MTQSRKLSNALLRYRFVQLNILGPSKIYILFVHQIFNKQMISKALENMQSSHNKN